MSTADRLAILEAIQRYSYATDSRDAEAYAALFSLRGVFEVTSATRPQPFIHAEGRDGILEWVRGTMERWGDAQTRHHQSGTVFDALSVDAARTRTMLLESRIAHVAGWTSAQTLDAGRLHGRLGTRAGRLAHRPPRPPPRLQPRPPGGLRQPHDGRTARQPAACTRSARPVSRATAAASQRLRLIPFSAASIAARWWISGPIRRYICPE